MSTSAGFPVKLNKREKICPTRVIRGYPILVIQFSSKPGGWAVPSWTAAVITSGLSPPTIVGLTDNTYTTNTKINDMKDYVQYKGSKPTHRRKSPWTSQSLKLALYNFGDWLRSEWEPVPRRLADTITQLYVGSILLASASVDATRMLCWFL